MRKLEKLKSKHPNINAILVVTAVVLVWRGIWGISDLYLFPENEMLSYLISAFLGLFLLWIDDFRLSEISE